MRNALNFVVLAIVASFAATAEAAPRRFPVAIENLEAAPGNGGINPIFFAINLNGTVLLGGNPCVASGRSVALKQVRVGAMIEVTAIVTEAPGSAGRVCTMEYNPVFASVQTTVRANGNQVRDILIKNVYELGHDESAYDFTGRNDLVLSNVEVEPTNGGINPDAYAYNIKADVEKGGNPCVAANTQVRLVQQRLNGKIVVRGLRKVIDPTRVCTMEYNPVVVTIQTTVRGFVQDDAQVIVKNVEERGNDVDVADLL